LYVTIAHKLLNELFLGLKGVKYLIITIVLGLLFTIGQSVEYLTATFSMGDTVFGSIFYTLTGFHGFHVILGTFLLILQSFRNDILKINNVFVGVDTSI